MEKSHLTWKSSGASDAWLLVISFFFIKLPDAHLYPAGDHPFENPSSSEDNDTHRMGSKKETKTSRSPGSALEPGSHHLNTHDGSGWCWYMNANMTGVNLDGSMEHH